jgi:hypothetical protein
MTWEWGRVTTSAEVWAVIRARHADELVPFSSLSEPDGNPFGRPDEGRMMTEYGFKDADYPLLGVDTRWDIDPETRYKRLNEKTEYWLCVPIIAGKP